MPSSSSSESVLIAILAEGVVGAGGLKLAGLEVFFLEFFFFLGYPEC